MAYDYLNAAGAKHRKEKLTEWTTGHFVGYASQGSVSVAGNSKTVYKTSPETLFVPNGFIMGGTAAAAGLTTRGICGVSTPDGKGGCNKDSLFLNYDGNDSYDRKVVLGAGSVGTPIDGGAYTYSAVRGDQMVSYVNGRIGRQNKTYVIADLDPRIDNVSNPAYANKSLNSGEGEVTITIKELSQSSGPYYFKTNNSDYLKGSALRVGDVFYIKDSGVPDRWVSDITSINGTGAQSKIIIERRIKFSAIESGNLTGIKDAKVIGTDSDGKLEQHSLAISDIAELQSTLGRKLDGTPLESFNKATGNGVFSYTPTYGGNITKYKTLEGFIGSYYSVDKGGMVTNNYSYLYGVGRLGAGTYLGFVQVNRDYSSDNDAVYMSKGLYVSTGDALSSPSAYLVNGDSTTEYEVRLATEKDLANKQDKLVSGTNIKTVNGTSLLGSGNVTISTSLPSGSDVTLRTLSFKKGSSYSISGIYCQRVTISVAGSVGSEGQTSFTISSDYVSSFASGKWYVTASIVSGGYCNTLVLGMNLNSMSSATGGTVYLRRATSADSQTRTYDVDLIMVRLY